MNLYQRSERDCFSEHFNLLHAQFFDPHPISIPVQHIIPMGEIYNNTSLIEKEIQSQLLAGKYSDCLNFIHSLPQIYFRHAPVLSIYQAIAMLFNEDPEQDIEALLSQTEEQNSDGQLKGEIIAVRALISSYRGNQDRGIQLSLKALPKISLENTFFTHFLERNLGIAYMIKGKLHEAAMWYEKLLLSSHKLQDFHGILTAYNYLTCIRKVQGRLKEAGVIYKKALSVIEEHNLEEYPHSIKIIAGYGHLLIQWHKIEGAKKYLRKAIKIAKRTDTLLAQKAFQDLSEVFIRENDLRSALANIQECRQHFQQNNSDYFQLINELLLATEARIHLEAGRIDQAAAWLRTSGFESVSPQEIYEKFGDQLGYLLPVAVNVYLAKGMTDEALDLLNGTIPKYLHAGANTYLIRSLAALAVTYHKMGNTAKAKKVLLKAIDLGKPEDNFGDFVFVGRGLMPLLYEIMQSGIETIFSRKLLSIFSNCAKRKSSEVNLLGSTDPLSNRELDVLRLIARGMTNREIAGTLYLSANTIKSHSIKIYRKLDVNNRTQAVSKARLLGILPSEFSVHHHVST
jgi:LuxR family maltose regulon positive regulatory protein